MMATTYHHVGREIRAGEQTAAKRTVYFAVGTAESQTVAVSKAGGGFGASSSTASAIDGNLYKLVIDATDLDTEGELALRCAGATDTQYLYGLVVVAHDPFDAIAQIVDTTGASGVRLGDEAISAEALSAGALSAIGACVLREVVADQRDATGGLADVVNDIWRRVGFGLRVVDTDDETIRTYDGPDAGATLLVTETKAVSGSETHWTPS